jgi:ABC-type transport system involved in multi-copper enzyme maturation permease subunit
MPKDAHKGAQASLRRVRLIARHTLGEALRLRLTLLLVLLGAGLVLGALGLREFNFGSAELKFIGDFGLGALGAFGTLLAALATAQLFFNEIQGRAAYCVLTRPVRRWEYIWGKFAGIGALLALFTASLGALIAVLLFWRGAQLGVAAVPLPVFFCACAVQWLKLTLVAGMTLLVCSYSGSALFASCAGLILAAIAHLRPFAGGGSRMAWLRAWPNLALFDAESLLAAAQPPTAMVLFGAAGYWAVYVSVFGVLASYGFKHREF